MLKILQTRLKLLRKTYDMSSYEIASITGIGRSTLNEWENGSKIPTIDALFTLATHFGVSVDWLCGMSDTPYTAESVECAIKQHKWDRHVLDLIPCDTETGEALFERSEEFLSIKDSYSLEALANLHVLFSYPHAISKTAQIWFNEKEEFAGRNQKKIRKYHKVLNDLKTVFLKAEAVYKLPQGHE